MEKREQEPRDREDSICLCSPVGRSWKEPGFWTQGMEVWGEVHRHVIFTLWEIGNC